MNAYLPGLAREAPEVVGILEEESAQDEQQRGNEEVQPQGEDRDVNADYLDPLIPRPHSPFSSPHPAHSDVKARYDAALSRTTSRISSLGIALGYGAGIFLLLVALVPVTLMRGSTFALRVAIGLSGVWWGLFSVPAWLWLPSSSSASGAGGEEGVWDDVGEEREGGRRSIGTLRGRSELRG
jgi:UMF1 family MFS transporter